MSHYPCIQSNKLRSSPTLFAKYGCIYAFLVYMVTFFITTCNYKVPAALNIVYIPVKCEAPEALKEIFYKGIKKKLLRSSITTEFC